MKTFMVIEHYKLGKTKEIYQRFAKHVRMLPENVQYVESRVEHNLQECYQIMQAESADALNA